MANTNWYDDYKKKKTESTSGQNSTNWYDAYKKEKEESGNWVTRYQKDIVDRVNSLLSSHNSQIEAHNKRFSGRKENIYDNDYVSDAGDWYAASQENYSAYDKEASDLLSSIEGSSLFSDEWVNSVKESINGQRGQQKSMLDAAKSDNDFWSSFSSEDNLKNYGTAENAYKAAVSNAKDYDTKSKADLGALQVDYDDFLTDQKKFSDYNNAFQAIRNGGLSKEAADALVPDEEVADYVANGMSYQKAKEQYIQQKYAGYVKKYFGQDKLLDAYRGTFDPAKEMNNLVTEKKSYLESAKDIQKGNAYRSVLSNNDFDLYDDYASTGEKYDKVYEFINGADNGNRDKVIDSFTYRDPEEGYVSNVPYEYDLYEELDDEEISIYNYYYAKNGKAKADEYLESLKPSLEARLGQSYFKHFENAPLLELAFSVAAGLDQFSSGVESLFNFSGEKKAANATQVAAGLMREDLGDVDLKYYNFKEGKWKDKDIFGSSLGQSLFDLGSTTANMLPSILTSTAIGLINPTASAIAGNALMGASAAGNAYQEMINLGYSKQQAGAYGAMVGGSEALLSYALGGISALNGGNGGIFGSLVDDVLPAMDNAIARAAIQIGGNMLDEGLEEGIQEILDPWFKNLTLHTEEGINWNDVAYSTLLGALTAGIMEGPSTIAGEVKTYKTGKKLQDGGITAQKLAEVGHTFAADSVAYQLADKVTENTGAYTLGRLFNEIDATITQQNVEEISRELVRTGWDADQANYMANVFAQVVEGAEFSDNAIAMIEANDQYAQVLKSVLIDSNTTWNQRSVGYNAAVKALADSVSNPKSKQVKSTQENSSTEGATTTETKTAAQGNTEPPATAAKVNKIADIGKKTVTTEDGKTVSVKDAAVSADDQMRIDTIASIENITTDDANYILNTLRTRDGVSSKVDSLAAKEAYKYGYYGFSKDHIAKHGSFASYLTESQFNAIYKLGQQARQTKANKMPTKVVGPKGGIYFDKGGGEIVALKDVNQAAISGKKRSAGVQAAVMLNKLGIGGDIYFFESYLNENGQRVYKNSEGKEVVAPNGFFQGKDNSIHIDLNACAKGEGLVLFTLAHELTHFVEKWSPKKYKILADFLVENYEKGRSMDELVLAKQADLASKGQDVSYDKAFSEVVADSMEAMLADGNVIEKIRELKAKDKDLFDKIKEFFNNLLAKIRSVYQGLTPDSAEGQAVLQMKDSIEKIQQLFAEGLVEASENFQNAIVPGEDSVVVNDNGDPVAHATEDGTVQLSMRTYEESGRAELRKYLEKCVKNKSLTKDEMSEMLDGIEEIYTTCKEFKDKYAPFGSWSDAAVVRDTHGKPVFSVVTPNGEYKMNLDFSLVCKKRRTLDAVFNEMSKRGIIDDFELGQKSIVKINEIIRKYGLETACALCFVDAKRFRQADVADSFVKLYNDLVQSLVPESKRSSIGYFDFAGYGVKSAENGIHTWKNADLDFSHIDYVLKNYGSKTVEHKAAAYIKENADARKQLLRGDFMSSTAFDAVKSKNPTMMKLYNSKKGTGGPKAAFGDVQYMNEIIRNSRGWSPKKAFEVGGVRVQSFSDYVPRMVFDYVQMVYDMAAKKLPAHSYSKEAIFVKQFGLTGIKINMSLIPAVVDGGIAPGLDAKGNYVWAGESFDFETAKQIQKQKGYTENCGTICVGVSYDHIMKLLDDPEIRMVIPYHKSGLNPIVAHMNKVSTFTDYTSLSTNPKGCQSTIDRETGSKVEKDFNFNEELRKVGDPKVAAQNYLDWCEEHNYMPKFEEFASHENYYKLLTDFTVYDADGNYVAQREVTATFPTKESAFGDMKGLIESGLEEDAIIEGRRDKNLSSIVDEIQRTIPKTEAEIAEEQVEQADRDVEADTQYSIREFDASPEKVEQNTTDLAKMHPVCVVAASKLDKTGKRPTDIFAEYFDRWGNNIYSDELGDVELKKSSIRSEVRHGITSEKIASIEAIPDVIKKGKIIFAGTKVGTDVQRIVVCAPITIGNSLYYMGVMLQRDTQNQRLYLHNVAIEKEASEISQADLLTTGADESNEYLFITNILQKALAVKYKMQATSHNQSDSDSAYLDAVNRGDMETAQKMVDEAMNAAGFDTRGYHGTNGGDFHSFDWSETQRADAGWYGRGHYFATSRGEAAMYGKRVISAALRNPKPFNFHNELFTLDGVDFRYGNVVQNGVAFAINMAEKFPNIFGENTISVYDMENGGGKEIRWADMRKMLNDFMNDEGFRLAHYADGHYEWMYEKAGSWRSHYTHNNYMTKEEAMEAKPLAAAELLFTSVYQARFPASMEATYLGGDMYAADAFSRELIDRGYTGVLQAENGDEIVIFDGRNIKDASPVTYDDDGNIIPLSQRFNAENDDIRYQYRADDSVSNRSLLANAFESVAKNDIEKKRIKEYKDNIDSLNAEERKLQDLNKQIKELSFAKGKRDTQQIKDLQEEARKTANRIDTYDKRLLRLEASAPLQRVLERERTKAYKKAEQKGMEVRKAEQERAEKAYQKSLENLRESKRKALEKAKENREKSEAKLKEQFKESRERASENRTKTAMRHKIQGVVGELNQLLKADDKKRHIPDSLKKAVAEALALVNMDNLAVDKRVAEINKRLAELYDKKAKAEQSGDQLLADEIQVDIDGQLSLIDRYTKMSDKLQKLQSAYEDIKNSNDPDIASGYDPVIAGSLKELAESIGDTPLAKMSVDQLQDVYDMYKMVLTRVRDANKSLVDAQREAIKTRATKVVGEVKRVGGVHKLRVAALDFVKKFGWDNLKPVYAFEHIGSDTLTEAFNDVRKGEDTWAKDVTDARKFYLDKAGKYHYDSWDFDKKHSFESASSIKFDLTLEQILSLYAYSKRDKALEHLRLGGFVFDSNIETYKEKGSKLIKYKVNTADAHQITPEILADITGLLTKEQTDFVDEMQDYLSTTMGAKGNEVTMKMYGVKLFKEKFYFPLKSAKQFIFEQNEVAGEVRIKNSGFTNKTKPKANNPVILNNFMDVWTGHVNDMSMYHAFTLPLEDFNRIFNYESGKQEGQHAVSVKGTIQNAYGPAAVSYVRQLITDLNGGAVADPRESTAKALMAKFKKAKVFTSFSVVVQQPSAIGRAFALVDPKYFRPTKDGMSHKELWNEVKQYAPVAIIKEMGYFDTNMGRSASEYIQGKEYSGFTEKLKAFAKDGSYRDEVMSRLPALADEMSWCAIWNAVKRETVHNHQDLNPGSKEFLEAVGERFTEVITKTQVYDSVLARSGNMRSKTGFMNMATSFMAEPTTTINMLQDAIVQKARGKKKYAGRVFGSVLASIVLNNVLVSFVYAGRDDDEDETYIEKYLQSFVSGMLDDVNPITYYPFLKDMWSVLQGFDVERTDMSLFSDLADSMKAIVKAYNTDGGDVGGAWLDATGAAANLTGIPMQNIRREINAAINFYKTLFKDFNGRATTGKSLGNALVDSVRDTLPVVGWFPGKNKAAKLYDALVSGDDTYADRLIGSYKDEDAANSAIRSAIKKSYESGDIDEDTAMEHLVEYGGLENEKEESYYKKKAEDNDMTVQQYKEFELKNDAYWKLEEWKYEADSEDDFSKYDDFLSAVKTGKNLKKVVKEYTNHGVDEKTLASQITKYYKPLYKEMSKSERAAIKGYLLNAYALLGYNRAEKSRDINDWLKD